MALKKSLNLSELQFSHLENPEGRLIDLKGAWAQKFSQWKHKCQKRSLGMDQVHLRSNSKGPVAPEFGCTFESPRKRLIKSILLRYNLYVIKLT